MTGAPPEKQQQDSLLRFLFFSLFILIKYQTYGVCHIPWMGLLSSVNHLSCTHNYADPTHLRFLSQTDQKLSSQAPPKSNGQTPVDFLTLFWVSPLLSPQVDIPDVITTETSFL